MRQNPIDFPPWRKSCDPLQDLSLLTQKLVLTAQALELGGHVHLPVGQRVVHRPLTPTVNPVAQRRYPEAQIGGNVCSLGPVAPTQHETQG